MWLGFNLPQLRDLVVRTSILHNLRFTNTFPTLMQLTFSILQRASCGRKGIFSNWYSNSIVVLPKYGDFASPAFIFSAGGANYYRCPKKIWKKSTKSPPQPYFCLKKIPRGVFLKIAEIAWLLVVVGLVMVFACCCCCCCCSCYFWCYYFVVVILLLLFCCC